MYSLVMDMALIYRNNLYSNSVESAIKLTSYITFIHTVMGDLESLEDSNFVFIMLNTLRNFDCYTLRLH